MARRAAALLALVLVVAASCDVRQACSLTAVSPTGVWRVGSAAG